MRVASGGLRAAGCELRVARCGLRVAGCGLRVETRKDTESTEDTEKRFETLTQKNTENTEDTEKRLNSLLGDKFNLNTQKRGVL